MTDTQYPLPVIVAFVSDLMFTPRIARAAEYAGFRVEWIENAAAFGDIESDRLPEKPGEQLHGREGRLFERITALRPALLLFDLNNTAIPWRQWIPALKSSPATRRIPIMCYGPHEDVATMKLARDLGSEAVLARSRFTADMPSLFARYARVVDHATLVDTCAEPLSDLARQGLELFNDGAYYKCHDALEAAWMEDSGPGRDLYRGILQVGIAYHQIERGNYRGAVKMLLRARQWLGPLPDMCRGVNVSALRADADRVYNALVDAGPEQIESLDTSLFRPVRFS